MSDDPEALRARVAELEERCRSLELRVPGDTPRTSGRFIVRLIGGLLLLSFATALLLWTAAKRTSAARAEVASHVPKPAATRIDAVGRAVAHGIDGCVDEKPVAVPSVILVRVKLSPTGALGILNTTADPADDTLGACLRKIPQAVHVAAAGGDGAADVEVRYELSREADGARSTKITWAQRETAPAFTY